MELDRSPIPLPHLYDNDGTPPPDLPTALVNAHSTLSECANTTATKAATIASDSRWSEGERQRQLSALCTEAFPNVANAREVADAVERLADEHAATALRKALGRYESPRLLLIAQSLATRSREQKLSAVIRARNGGDYETLAAIVSAPKEIGLADDLDARLLDAMRDQLVDSVDPNVRQSVASTKFAVARMRVAVGTAEAGIRKATRTEATPAERIRRSA